MNSVLVTAAVLKVLNFLRVYESFDKLAHLVLAVLRDTRGFLCLFIGWVLLLSLLY